MKTTCTRNLIAAALFASIPLLTAQAAEPTNSEASTLSATETKTFSKENLNQILAPIALYPDDLLAQVLMASTYPLEIVMAARWQKENPGLTGKALEEAMQQQSWDPSVKSLTAVPEVLKQMNEKIDWVQKLGDAFLAQKADVMNTIQALRAKADSAGNLKTTPEQNITTESSNSETIYIIQSAKPEVVYVPTYNPSAVYGPWPYPAYPPYSMYPPSYVYPHLFGFATGVFVGAAIWGNTNWFGHDVDINVNHYNSFNRTNINNNNWNHNVEHRKGVAYKDKNIAQKYNRGASADKIKSREEFRGRTDQGFNAPRDMSNKTAQNKRPGREPKELQHSRPGEHAKSQAQKISHNRDLSPGNRSGDRQLSRNSSAGFSGGNNWSSTRQASDRGHASRSGMQSRSGGGGGGRGRR